MTVTLRLMCSNSTRALLQELSRGYEARSGQEVGLEVATAKAVRQRIESGVSADAVVLGSAMIAELVAAGWLAPQSQRPFAVARVGVAVRRGFPKPDIGSVAALRQTLVSARSITHTIEGASGQYVPALLDRLGIAGALKGRIVTQVGGPVGPIVVAGEADLALQQVPELLGIEGLEVVGPIPEEVQRTFETSTAIFTRSSRASQARALLDYLAQPAHGEVFRAHGLEPLGWAAPDRRGRVHQ
ncbi:MAG: substrate-binding domain-containing protein [Betaproteobacteria bacterium]|jgi:molybdate transport system substrate-binding protein